MTILTNKEYETKKINLLHESGGWRVDTSLMDEFGKYIKTYICNNGNVIIEVNRPVYEMVDIEIKGVKTQVQVTLFESEMFSNKWDSVYTYQKY